MKVENIADPKNFVAKDLSQKIKSVDRKSQAVYERLNLILTQNKSFVTITLNDVIGESENMNKFGAVIGNPPYNEMDGGGTGDSSKPVYDCFVNLSQYLSTAYVSLIIPSRWMKGGKGLNYFRSRMIKDKHFVTLVDFENAKECFPMVHLDSGVCYFLWNRDYSGLVNYTFKPILGESFTEQRELCGNLSNTIIRDSRQISILNKIDCFGGAKFNSIVSSRKPYGIATDLFNRPDNYTKLDLKTVPQEGYSKIYGVKGKKGGAKRLVGYIKTDEIKNGLESIEKYKLFFSYAYTTTATVPPQPIVGMPNEVCTETFLRIGSFDCKSECLNCLSYIKTRFFRALLFFNRVQKNASKRTFSLIPLQDFTEQSDIDWSKSIPEIDAQLYKKYGLTEEEIAFIESMIKPME